MRKKYVLDISVLLRLPEAVLCFGENEVILPDFVPERLDALTKDEGNPEGLKARSALRLLARLGRRGKLSEGVLLENGGVLRIEKFCDHIELPKDLPAYKSDNRMLQVCKGLSLAGAEPVILVTENIFMRTAAQIVGIQAETFSGSRKFFRSSRQDGLRRVYVPEERFKDIGEERAQINFLKSLRRGGAHPVK